MHSVAAAGTVAGMEAEGVGGKDELGDRGGNMGPVGKLAGGATTL